MLHIRDFGLRRDGVECDGRGGLRVGGVPLLSSDYNDNWFPRSASELSHELSEIYGFPITIDAKMIGVAAIGRALRRGDLAWAQIAALFLQIPDPPPRRSLSRSERQRLSDDLTASKLLDFKHLEAPAGRNFVLATISGGKSDSRYSKNGFNPNEPRNRYGEWTNAGNAEYTDERGAHVEDTAYQGSFHDQVAQEEIEHYRKTGAMCVSEVRLMLGAVTARVDILCRGKTGLLLGVEVKTGLDPEFTPNQSVVYDHAIFGGLTSPDPKIAQLGFTPNQPLPPIEMFMLYVAGVIAQGSREGFEGDGRVLIG